MHRQRHSIAGPTKGITNPEEIHMYEIEGGDGGAVFLWSGNEYTRDKTWISGDEKAVLDLSEMR